jgi:peptidoglycan/xylan/chitin deacetylase (PgdA/CDA1 family)
MSPAGARARLSILMYHRVRSAPDLLTGDPDAGAFDAQMLALAQYFNVLPLAEAVERLRTGGLPARAASITFDDGYRDNLEVALPILKKHRLSATIFIANGFLDGGRMFNDTVIEAVRRIQRDHLDLSHLGLGLMKLGSIIERRQAIDSILLRVKYLEPQRRQSVVDELAGLAGGDLPDDLMLRSEQVGDLARAGIDIGGHTVRHPILASVSLDEASEEIRSNRAFLEQVAGRDVTLFAYPNGQPGQDYLAEHVSIVRSLGFAAAVSTSWGAASAGTDLFQLPRFTPWDREPKRFVLRLLHNAVARTARVAPPAAAAMPA